MFDFQGIQGQRQSPLDTVRDRVFSQRIRGGGLEEQAVSALGEMDQVRLGEGRDLPRAERILLERGLDRVWAETGGGMEKAVGESPGQLSSEPRTLAGLMLDEITGPIYERFRVNEAPMDRAKLGLFREEVETGLEKGVQDSRDILRALGNYDAGRQEMIDATHEAALAGLDRFFEEQMEGLSGS